MHLQFLLAVALAAAGESGPQSRPGTALPEQAFVVADVLRVRSAPAADAPIVGRLRIGTQVSVLEPRGAWVRVALPSGGWDGWASRALLREKPLTLEEVMAQAAVATGPERIASLERAVAIDPTRPSSWEALAKALEEAGQKERARSVGATSRGEDPGFLALCFAGTAGLSSEWIPGKSLRSLVGAFIPTEEGAPPPPTCARLQREHSRLAAELPAVAWFRFDGASLGSAPFPQARPLREDDMEYPTTLSLRMGSCDPGAAGWMATTTPLEPLRPKPTSMQPRWTAALSALSGVTIARAEARSVDGTPELTEVRFEGVTTAGGAPRDATSGAPIAAKERVAGWALFGSAAEPIHFELIQGVDPTRTASAGKGWISAEIFPGAWSLLALRPGVRVAAIHWRRTYGPGSELADLVGLTSTDGFWIVTVDAKGSARVELRPEPSGCKD